MVDAVKVQDRDRFLSLMCAQSEYRHAMLSVLAFHCEVARIRESIKEPTMGYIRLQWWIDSLSQPIDNVKKDTSPIVRALMSLSLWDGLKPHLLEILDARQRDIERKPFSSVDDAVQWVSLTTRPLVKALAVCQGKAASEQAYAAAKAHGVLGALRSTAYNLKQGRAVWAFDMRDETFRKDLSKDVVACAEDNLSAAKSQRIDCFSLLVPGVLAKQHIQRLKKNAYEPFDPLFSGPSQVNLPFLWSWFRHTL